MLLAGQSIADPCPDDPSAVLDEGLGGGSRHDRRAVFARRTSHREGVSRIVLDAVMKHQPAAEPFAPHRGGVSENVRYGQVAMPAPVPARAEHVVQRHPGLVEGARRHREAEQREQERLDRHQMRREVEDPRSLGQGFTDEPESVLLEIAQATVDQARGPR